MITVHHLQASRSDRIIWLLEELGAPYQLKVYARDPATHRAPPELAALHPLGKSPLISVGERVVMESGAIVEYLVNRCGKRDWQVTPADDDYTAYLEWMHFAEGSAMAQLLLELFMSGELMPELGLEPHALTPVIQDDVNKMLSYVDAHLADRPYFAGERITGADIMMAWTLVMCDRRGKLGPFPAIQAYLRGIEQRPAFIRMQEATAGDSF